MNITNLNTWQAWARSFPQRADGVTPYVTPFRVVNKGGTNGPAEVLIYDQIGRDFWSGEGMAANDFAALLKDIGPTTDLIVGINSPGGNVWDGLAIFNQLQAHKGKVTTRNDGMAASIASVILQAGSERQSHESAMVMIHRAWGLMVGNAGDAEQFKKDLEKHDKVISELYARRSGQPEQGFVAAMAEETIYTGKEAQAAGLVDTILTPKKNNLSAVASNIPVAAIVPTVPAAPALPSLTASAIKPGVPMNAAGTSTNPQAHTVMPDITPAPAASTPPVQDLTPLLNAINALGEKLTATGNTLPGTSPVNVVIENHGNPAVEKFKNLEHGGARANFIRDNYQMLGKRLVETGVFNTNTVDSSLANSLLASEAVQTMRTTLAPLNAFTRQVELSPLSPRQVINVPLVSTAGGIQTNPTSFESGDTTEALIAVTVNQYSRSFYTSHAESNSGLKLANKAPTNAAVLAENIVALVTAKMIVGSYGATTTIGAASSFDSADLPAILALGKNYRRCTLLLDGGHLAYLLPTTREHFAFGEAGAFGFDGGIYKNNLWTGATTNTAGFVCGPDALVIATGLPAVLPSGEFIAQENVVIGAGISVTASTWFSRASRAMWASFDVMFGVAVGDATQAEVLVTS